MDNQHLYSIGDAARRSGLSVSAVRFYADAGVVPPTDQPTSGRRFYDIGAIARLELVRTLRDLGSSLDEIRRLLAEETTLRDLAAANLDLLERQLRDLHARRAVLRTIVNQPTGTDRLALMHSLVSMSDEHRNQLLDRFWTEVTEGLTVHPEFTAQLHRLRPQLPPEPGTEQLQAWIELADLVQEQDFRDAVRQFLHTSFASPKALALTAPPRMARIEAHRLLEVAAAQAEQSGLPPESPRAREIAEELFASVAELTADATGAPLTEADLADLRQSMIAPDRNSASHQAAERAVAGFTGVFQTYLSLMATINGTPQPDPADTGVSEQWLAAALRE